MSKAPRYMIDVRRHPGVYQLWTYDSLREARHDMRLERKENPEAVMRLYKLMEEIP